MNYGHPLQFGTFVTPLALDYGMSGLILAADDAYSIELFASEVGPAARTSDTGSSGVIRG